MSATVGVQLSVPLAGLPPVALKLAAEGLSGAPSVTTWPALMSCAATVIVSACPTSAVTVARSAGVGALNTGHAWGGAAGDTWSVTPQLETAPHTSVAVKLTARSPVSAAVGVQLKRLLAGFPLVTTARLPGPPLWASVTRSPASPSPPPTPTL